MIVIALNEERSLPVLLKNLEAQRYDHKKTEVILVDGMSTDKTRLVMQEFASSSDFKRVVCLDNPKKILAGGWNVALSEARGDVIIRLDAHASVPPDFIEKNIRCILSGYDICGGKVKNYIPDETPWSAVLNAAENSMFGGSIASFRHQDKPGFVGTLAFGAYRREVFEKTGAFNEQLHRTEDNEMHYRMRKEGYRFYYNPDIVSYRETRPSFKKLSAQKNRNGYWIGKTVKICPGCISWYHMIPFLFVSAVMATTALAFFGVWQTAAVMWGCYALVTLLMTAAACVKEEKRSVLFLALPFLFFILHVSYGTGTLTGLLSANGYNEKNFRFIRAREDKANV